MNGFQEKLQAAAAKMSQNTIIQSITHGMLGILSISIGVCAVSILVNLPIDAWKAFLTNTGLLAPANELIAATTSMLAIYVVISVAYSYAKNVGQDSKSTTILATAVFIILMPQTVTVGDKTVSALLSSNLGSNGIFVAIIVAVLVGVSYNFLITHNVKIKMPEQVPPMVVDSMTPIIGAMIIFTVTFFIKWGISLTEFKDIFTLFYKFLTAPVMAILGNTWVTPVIYCVLRSIFWFFGIHPSPLNAIYFPLSSVATAANVEAFMAGMPLPYLDFSIMATFGLIGGTGSTFALSLNMLSAKSIRYKTLNKVGFIPSVFNINEPLVFGVPIMYNLVMLIPTVAAPIVGAIIGKIFIMLNFINSTNLNPTVSVAWVIPYPIAAFLRGGIPFLAAVLISIVAQYFIYKPFFKMIDKQELAIESENASSAE